MDTLTKEDLERFMGTYDGLRISIYMPTHRESNQALQDPIRLKNLLQEAEQRLLEHGISLPEVNKLLRPAQALLDDRVFWQNQSDGLALFLSTEGFNTYRLPCSFDELVVVGERFHIKPLLPLFNGGRFYLLALSQNNVRLFRCTRYAADEVSLEGVPTSLAEAMRYEDPERQLQHHLGEKVNAAASGIFHGHGVGSANFKKENILRFFQQVDRGIRAFVEQPALLVLAGVEYLLPIYREANKYPHLIDGGVLGNPDEANVEELHEEAWSLVQPHYQKERDQAVAEYRRLADGEGTSSALIDVLPAAHFGRVDVLFVASNVQRWGQFDSEQNTLVAHDNPEPGDEDLLDLAAVQTLMRGGTVYSVEASEVPGDKPLAAVFRY
jgi:hypothetical protein